MDKAAKDAAIARLKANWTGWADRAHCRCGRVALSGRQVCYLHGRRPGHVVSIMRQAGRDIWRLNSAGKIPDALRGMEVFRLTYGGPLRFRPACLALIHAWHQREVDPLVWIRAVESARAVLANG